MNDINRIMILILLVGLLYALYVYQERNEEKSTPKPKRRSTKRVETPDDSQTLASLMDVESFRSFESKDSLFD